MIHTKYCQHCSATTSWFKDMCMKCQKKEGPTKQQIVDELTKSSNDSSIGDLFGELFKGAQK